MRSGAEALPPRRLAGAPQPQRVSGVESALLHGGTSSIVALGAPPDLGAWPVAIEGGLAPIAELRDCSLSVSAQHARRLASGVGHVLDPRTRRSADSENIVAVL